jgi:hypothetical protein
MAAPSARKVLWLAHMKRKFLLIGIVSAAVLVVALRLLDPVRVTVDVKFHDAAGNRSCCSWHGGQCGCQGGRVVCCDGALSSTCTC